MFENIPTKKLQKTEQEMYYVTNFQNMTALLYFIGINTMHFISVSYHFTTTQEKQKSKVLIVRKLQKCFHFHKNHLQQHLAYFVHLLVISLIDEMKLNLFKLLFLSGKCSFHQRWLSFSNIKHHFQRWVIKRTPIRNTACLIVIFL